MLDLKMAEAKVMHRELFKAFCQQKYLTTPEKVSSKTVNEDKAKRIKQILRGENLGENLDLHSSSFRFWVKKTKKFEIHSYPNLHDVLCVPMKSEVSI